MEGLIRWWVRNPVAANLLMLIVITAGYLGLRDIEKEAFPSVQPDIVQVEIVWPGAAPKEVEQQVVQRVEEALKNVRNVYRVTSDSRDSYGSVTVQTFPSVDLDSFLSDVKNAVDSVTAFPRDIENPSVRRLEWRKTMMRVVVAGEIGEGHYSPGERLRNDLANLPHITGRNCRLASRGSHYSARSGFAKFGLSFSDVANAIRLDSMNVSVGAVQTETGDVQLRAENLADTQSDFERIVIRQTPNGGQVRVMDVATVIDGFEQDQILAALDGRSAIVLEVDSTEDTQEVKASQAVKKLDI